MLKFYCFLAISEKRKGEREKNTKKKDEQVQNASTENRTRIFRFQVRCPNY